MSTDLGIESARAPVRPESRRGLISANALRMAHSYVSAFIAPTIVFFAISGSLQILGLQDPRGNYKPSSAMSSIARLHKQQVFAPEPDRPQFKGPPPVGAGPRPPETSAPTTLLLKALFFLEAWALVITTVLGVWIGVTHAKRARTFWILIGAGVAVPVLLLIV